ncbi:MAG: ADP,ATP carrier protein 1 [Chlamydiae bacterium]|nr:ADP,ATP carrier protein 1 [Chlamydiota bacterium]
MSDQPSFSRLRSYLWPIRGSELRKFLPLVLMAFFIGFNYNILRNMKDALLITAESSGAEVLPFIKVWGIVPAALLMTFIYSRLNNKLRRDRVFQVMVAIFLGFFALFTFVIFPIRDLLHPHQLADHLQTVLPAGFKGLIAMFRYWTYSSFYIMSELWSSTILSMLFWGFANEVTKLAEAKRFYGLIAMGLNLAAITSGVVSVFLTGEWLRGVFSICENPWHNSIVLLTSVVLLSGLAILGIYRYLTNSVFVGEEHADSVASKKTAKIKLSMRESFAYLGRSKYLISIAVIVLSYNVVINLLEVIWKDSVRELYPNPNNYNAYMSQITMITGAISLFASLFLSGQLIRKMGWTFTALVTPVVLLLTSVGFFTFFFGGNALMGMVTVLGTSPLALVVFFGAAQNCLSRAAKFTLFDSTKEMAFIPLTVEAKLKGKTVIDGVGSRLGKSGGSLIHQTLLIVFTTISASAHIVAGILLAVGIFWIAAVMRLGKQFNALTQKDPAMPATPAPATTEETEVVEAEEEVALTP